MFMLRIFCAIELSDEVRERAAAHTAFLRQNFPRAQVSWERAEKLHITLKFLGEIEDARVEDLARAVKRAAEKIEPFGLSIENAGAFPPRGAPRILWLGIRDDAGALARLQRLLEDECAAENFPREARSFHPHLTIARIRSPREARELLAAHRTRGFAPINFKVDEIVMMRSDLQPSGSRYTKLSSFQLSAAR